MVCGEFSELEILVLVVFLQLLELLGEGVDLLVELVLLLVEEPVLVLLVQLVLLLVLLHPGQQAVVLEGHLLPLRLGQVVLLVHLLQLLLQGSLPELDALLVGGELHLQVADLLLLFLVLLDGLLEFLLLLLQAELDLAPESFAVGQFEPHPLQLVLGLLDGQRVLPLFLLHISVLLLLPLQLHH
jgi:hypothetical protein